MVVSCCYYYYYYYYYCCYYCHHHHHYLHHYGLSSWYLDHDKDHTPFAHRYYPPPPLTPPTVRFIINIYGVIINAAAEDVAYLTEQSEHFGDQNDGRIFFDEFVQLLSKRERQLPGEKTDPKVTTRGGGRIVVPSFTYRIKYINHHMVVMMMMMMMVVGGTIMGFFPSRCWNSFGSWRSTVSSVKMMAITWRQKEHGNNLSY